MIAPQKKSHCSIDQHQLYDDSEPDPTSNPPSIWFSKRFFVGLLLFFGYLMYSMACQVVNLALVEMTVGKVEIIANETIIRPPEFNWSFDKIAMILNMFWYGFFFSTIGGYLAQRFGGAVVLGISTLMTGVITLFNPITVHWGFYPFLVSRGLVGLFESISSASNSEVLARWVPKQERSTFISSVMNGMYVGTAVTYPFCGFLAQKWGWPVSFYAVGALCVTWSIIWLAFGRNTPSADKWISKKELDYILEGTGNSSPKRRHGHPFREIFKSPSYWALSIGKFAFNWSSAFTVVYLPLYIKVSSTDLLCAIALTVYLLIDATQTNISQIGLLASIPNISIFVIPTIGGLMNYWQNHTTLKITQIHKIVISGSYLLSSLLFAVIAISDNFTTSIICFIIIKLLLSCNKIFLEVITVNMAPNHSGLLSGLSLFWQTIGIIVTQTIVGFVVKNHKLQEWNICFLLSTGVLLFSAVIFMIFGSSDPQPWSVIRMSKNDHEVKSQNEEPIE